MKFFNLDSPLMNFLGKMADLMWLNILTMICCIPVITAGAALTAMHYMALKIIRDEECYITKGYFKSFKENFVQATLIWLILAAVTAIIAGDFYIILNAEIELHNIFKIILVFIAVCVLFTATFVFPMLAKFENNIKNTFKNALFMSVWQFPRTVLMIVMAAAPIVLGYFFYQIFPFIFLFGLSLPAFGAAWLYNKPFQKLEDRILGVGESAEESEGSEEDDERIFKDELDESIQIAENGNI